VRVFPQNLQSGQVNGSPEGIEQEKRRMTEGERLKQYVPKTIAFQEEENSRTVQHGREAVNSSGLPQQGGSNHHPPAKKGKGGDRYSGEEGDRIIRGLRNLNLYCLPIEGIR